MSLLTKARMLSVIASNPKLINCPSKYLFMLSHMRSRSSVLSHVLGSNPAICGYSELHRSYNNRLDLLKMRTELYEDALCDLRDKYLLDKLLHNHCRISDQILDFTKPKVIFLLREPDSTLKSIINMGHRTGVEWYQDPEKAADYYCARLACLEQYGEKLKGEYFFLDADEIVTDTDHVLAQLSTWLELEEPLSRKYAKFKNTGKRHYGDSSEHIAAGVIKKTEGHKEIDLPAKVLQRALNAYDHCRQQLLVHDRRLRLIKRSA